MNIQYFKRSFEQDLASLIEAVAQKQNSASGSSLGFISSGLNWMGDKLQGKRKRQAMSEVDKILEQNKKLQERLPGKKKAERNDISCSCASGDNVYLGFGNGALAVVDMSREPNSGRIHRDLIEHFSGDEGHAIDKMRVVYIEGPTPAEAESHLLSLTNGSIICHSMPELQPMDDVLDINEFILDFEVYRHSSSKSLRASA